MTSEILGAIEATIRICTAITLIASVTSIITTLIGRARAPEKKQDERLLALEERMTKAEERLIHDAELFDEREKGNKIMLQSLLALMRHAIDGNNVDTLKNAARELDDYLVKK